MGSGGWGRFMAFMGMASELRPHMTRGLTPSTGELHGVARKGGIAPQPPPPPHPQPPPQTRSDPASRSMTGHLRRSASGLEGWGQVGGLWLMRCGGWGIVDGVLGLWYGLWEVGGACASFGTRKNPSSSITTRLRRWLAAAASFDQRRVASCEARRLAALPFGRLGLPAANGARYVQGPERDSGSSNGGRKRHPRLHPCD